MTTTSLARGVCYHAWGHFSLIVEQPSILLTLLTIIWSLGVKTLPPSLFFLQEFGIVKIQFVNQICVRSDLSLSQPFAFKIEIAHQRLFCDLFCELSRSMSYKLISI